MNADSKEAVNQQSPNSIFYFQPSVFAGRKDGQ